MSDELRLQKMLDEATAPGSDFSADLDAETSSLREAWLALGRTLAAAEAAAGPPREFPQLATAATRRSWSKIAILALAASLLILAGAITLRGFNKNVAVKPPAEADTKLLEGWEWDEAIDTEINNARQGVVWFGQDRHAASNSFPLAEEEIQEIQADINDSTF